MISAQLVEMTKVIEVFFSNLPNTLFFKNSFSLYSVDVYSKERPTYQIYTGVL